VIPDTIQNLAQLLRIAKFHQPGKERKVRKHAFGQGGAKRCQPDLLQF
jgi:hypothetical protein